MLVQFAACSKKSDPTPAAPTGQEVVQAKLVANHLENAKRERGRRRSIQRVQRPHPQFHRGGLHVFQWWRSMASLGQWSFTQADATAIKRGDGIQVNVEVTDTTLKLT